jgi:arsenite-transporting ATPase
VAEQVRLVRSLQAKGVAQNYIIHNRYEPDLRAAGSIYFPDQTIVRLPNLPRQVEPQARVEGCCPAFVLVSDRLVIILDLPACCCLGL